MRKENIQRLKGTLPRGQFMMTVRKAASDLDVSISTISRLVNEFIDLGILRLISRGVKEIVVLYIVMFVLKIVMQKL